MLLHTCLLQPLSFLQRKIVSEPFDTFLAFYTGPDTAIGVSDDFYSFCFLLEGFDPLVKQCEVRRWRG
jgi:hypothetical protein